MSTRKRPFPMLLFSGLGILAASFFIALWGSPLAACLGWPGCFQKAYEYFRYASPWRTAHLFYENTLAFGYLFSFLGLAKMRRWAHRMLVFLLAVQVLERTGVVLSLGLLRHELPGPLAAAQLPFSALLLLFVSRGYPRKKMEEFQAREVPLPPLSLPPPAFAGPSEEEGTAERNADSIAPLRGIETFSSWLLAAGGIAYSLQWKLSITQAGILGGCWGAFSFLLCLYAFRAGPAAYLSGGLLAVGLYFAVDTRWPLAHQTPLVAIGVPLLINFLGGGLAGLTVRSHGWFHGSAAGFLWAAAWTGHLIITEGRGEIIQWPLVRNLLAAAAIALAEGLPAAAAGGFLGTWTRRRVGKRKT